MNKGSDINPLKASTITGDNAMKAEAIVAETKSLEAEKTKKPIRKMDAAKVTVSSLRAVCIKSPSVPVKKLNITGYRGANSVIRVMEPLELMITSPFPPSKLRAADKYAAESLNAQGLQLVA